MNAHGPNMTSQKKPHPAISKLTRMAAEVEEFFRENRARQVSLSLAGVLLLLLLLGPAVPQELRAEAGSRLANLAQYLDTSLTDAWYSAFAAKGSDHRAGVSGNHNGSGSQHIGASRILTGGEAHPSVDASESLVDFDASFGAGSESNSTDGGLSDMLQSDMLQDVNPGGGGFGALAGSSASGNGSGGTGHQQSSGMGGSAGGAAPAGASRSSSSTHSSSARSRKSDRTNAHGRVTGGVYNVADSSWNQPGPNESPNALEPGGAAWSGAGNDPFPTNGDVAGLNGHPPQGEGGTVFPNGPVYQNEGNGGNGHLGPPKLPDPHTGDQGSFNQPPVTEPDSGPVSSVPEPGSLVLMSLGLAAVILWGKFRPAR
jgi:hypothetical protein